jgi:hypothetical protein
VGEEFEKPEDKPMVRPIFIGGAVTLPIRGNISGSRALAAGPQVSTMWDLNVSHVVYVCGAVHKKEGT